MGIKTRNKVKLNFNQSLWKIELQKYEMRQQMPHSSLRKLTLLTSLSPWTVRCFFNDARSLNILPHDSRWQANVLYWDYLMTFIWEIPEEPPAPDPPFPPVRVGSLFEWLLEWEIPPLLAPAVRSPRFYLFERPPTLEPIVPPFSALLLLSLFGPIREPKIPPDLTI